MPPRIFPAHPKRVLAFFPHRRLTGRTALDGSALVPRSFATLEMRHPHVATDAHLELLVARSVERYRPALVAIGVAGRSRRDVELGRWAGKVVRHFGIDCVFVDVTAAAACALQERSLRGFDRLAQEIATHIPDLSARVLAQKGTSSTFNRRRCRSYAWKAALAALAAAGHPKLAHSFFDATSL